MKRKRKQITNLADESRPNAGRLHQLWQNARATERPAAAASELLLYDRIGPDYWSGGGLTHQFVTDWLGALPAGTNDITVRINSPGGDVFEGVGIYNALLTWQAAQTGRTITVRIDAMAASIASVIAMAGDEIVIAGNAMMMIHRASTITWGNAGDHTAAAQTLSSIDQLIMDTYEARTGQTPEDLKTWLDGETFMTAAEAVDRGFADRAEALKTKTEATPPPDNASRLQAENRLASARLLQAQNLQSQARAHLASLQN